MPGRPLPFHSLSHLTSRWSPLTAHRSPSMRLLLASMLLLSGCEGSAQVPPHEFDGAGALRYVEAQLGFGPRIPGREGHRRMAAWLDSLLRTRADSVVVQRWTHVTR